MSEKAKISSELVGKKETKVDILNDIYSFLDEKIETDSYFEFGTSKKKILKKWFGENKINLDDNGLIDKQVKELEEGLNFLNLSKEEKDKSVILLLDNLRNEISSSFKIEDEDISKDKSDFVKKLDLVFNLELDKLDDDYVNRKLDHLFNLSLDGIDEKIISQKIWDFEKKKLEQKNKLKIEQKKLEEIKTNKLKTEELENKKIEEQRIIDKLNEEKLLKEKADEEINQAIIDVDKKKEDLDDKIVKNIKEKQIEEKSSINKTYIDKLYKDALEEFDRSNKVTEKEEYSSVLGYLESKGIDSSYKFRKKVLMSNGLGKKYGLDKYEGGINQNIKLLKLLKNDKYLLEKFKNFGG